MGWINSMAGGIAGGTAQLVRTITGGVANAARNMFVMIGRLVLAGIGAAFRGVQSAIGAVFHGFERLAQGAARLIGGVLKGALYAVGAAVVSIAALAVRATASLREMGNAINSLRGSTGLGARASGAIVNNFSAYGIKASDTASMLEDQNPMRMRMMAQAWNLPGQQSRGFIPALAQRFQGMDPMMRRSMLQGIGMDNDAMRRTLIQPVSSLRQQAGFQQRVQTGMGVDPSVTARVAQQLDVVTNQFRVLGETALTRIAAESLPRVIRAFEVLSGYLANNAGSIGEVITKGVDAVFAAIIRLGEGFLVIPPIFKSVGLSVLDFATVAVSALPQVWEIFLSGISVIQNALTSLTSVALPAFQKLPELLDVFYQGFLHLVDFAEEGWNRIGGAVEAVMSGIGQGLDAIANSALFRQLMRAAPLVPRINEASNSLRTGVENTALRMGLPPDVAAGAGAISPYVLGSGIMAGLRGAVGWGARALGVGGAAAGAGAGAGAAARGAGLLARAGGMVARGAAFLSNPIVDIAGTGALLGYGGYEAIRERGWAGPDAGVGMEAVRNAAGRLWAGITTGNVYSYDNNLNQQWFDEAHRPRQSTTPATDAINRAVSGVRAAWNAPHGDWANRFDTGVRNLPQTIAGAGRSFMDMPRSPWANNLESRFGDTVRDRSSDALATIARLREKLEASGEGPEVKLLRDMLGALKEGNQNTRALVENGASGGSGRGADNVAAFMTLRYAKESGAALRRQGG